MSQSASLAAISDTALDAVVATDDAGAILSWNRIAEAMFGWSEAEVHGRLVHELIIPPRDRQAHVAGMARYKATGEVRILGTRLQRHAIRRDGSEIPIELAVMLAKDQDEYMFVSFLRDMSPEKEAAAQIAQLQAEVVHLARVGAMNAMAATLAHELNQPLAAASNYLGAAARMLDSGMDPAQIRFGLEKGRDAVRRAADTIKSVRQMVEKKHLASDQYSLKTLVRETRALLGAELSAAMKTQIADDADIVFVNRVQVEQVLINLVRNASDALRGHSSPEIMIRAKRTDKSVQVCVSDNGPGIPAEQAASLFSPFASTKSEGLGMGLSICRTIVEQHGGRIWVEEDRPTGTSICFLLPSPLSYGAPDLKARSMQ